MKHEINGLFFSTDKLAEEHAKGILYNGHPGTYLTPVECDFMVEYFEKFHHDWEGKKGVGVAAIVRVKDKVFGKHLSFEVVRIDGSQTDISYILGNIKVRNLEKDFKNALRAIIEPQIFQFKAATLSQGDVRCPITNEVLSMGNCHVDHLEPTFDQIVKVFREQNRIEDLKEVVATSRDNQRLCELRDEDIGKRFFEYHLKVANLRLLSPTGNLTRKRK